jgi:hypothetical protein
MSDSDASAALRRATAIGAGSLAIGGGLLASPRRLGGAVGFPEAVARAVGIADLAVVPGLVAGRPRWPWMLARAGLNVPIAVAAARSGTTAGRVGAAALAAVTVADLRLAGELRAAGA